MISTPIYACITEAAIANFQQTWLMIKQHKITRKLYFCKTIGKDPINYLGSGLHWRRHINKHGKEHVETIWHQLYTDIYELVDFALTFSEDCDIVKSKEWANLKPENGLDGGFSDVEHQRQGGRATTKHRRTDPIFAEFMREVGRRGGITTTSKPEFIEIQQRGVEAATSKESREKRKISFLKIKHQQGDRNSQFGTCWITKDKQSIKIKKNQLDEYIQNGYSKGRVIGVTGESNP